MYTLVGSAKASSLDPMAYLHRVRDPGQAHARHGPAAGHFKAELAEQGPRWPYHAGRAPSGRGAGKCTPRSPLPRAASARLRGVRDWFIPPGAAGRERVDRWLGVADARPSGVKA